MWEKLKQLHEKIKQDGRESEHQYIPLGWIGLISFFGYYFIWHEIVPANIDSIIFRIVGGTLCLFLVLKNHWPERLKYWLAYYWYFVLFFCFPYFFSYMMLKNPESYVWLMTNMTGIFFMMLLVGWVYFFILNILGFLAAYLTCYLLYGNVVISSELIGTLPTCITVIIGGIIFIQRDQVIRRDKLKVIKYTAASLAHEIRTPLTAMKFSEKVLRKYFPTLMDGYNLAKENHLLSKSLSSNQITNLQNMPDILEKETDSAFLAIDLMLANTDSYKASEEIFSISDCIEEAIKRYPFSDSHRDIVKDMTFFSNVL